MSTAQEIFSGNMSVPNINIVGTNGTGYVQLGSQTTAVSTPSNSLSMYANNNTQLTLAQPDGFTRTLAMPATSNKVYTIPDVTSSSFVMTAGNSVISGQITASNISGSNSGDVTLAAVGNTPNVNGATLAGQQLNLQPASSTLPGVITATTQTFGGAKTFNNTISVAGDITGLANITLPASTSSTGAVNINGNRFLHGASNNTFVGPLAGNFSLTGTTNVCVGSSAGTALTTGTGNVFIGSSTGANIATGSNNIVLGNTATVEGSNRIIIGSPSSASTQVYGIPDSAAGNRVLTINTADNRLYASAAYASTTVTATTCSLVAYNASNVAINIIQVDPAFTFGTYSIVAGVLVWSTTINVVRIGKMVFVYLPSFIITDQQSNVTYYAYTNFSPALPAEVASTHQPSQLMQVLIGNTSTVSIGIGIKALTSEILIYRSNTVSTFRENAPGCGVPRPTEFIYEAS